MSQEGTSKPKKSVAWGWIIGGLLVIVIAAGFGIKAIEGSFTYYLTADEFVQNRESYEGKRVKVAGKVKEGSLHQNGKLYAFVVEFQGESFPVRYEGFAPDTFKEGVEVVVEGRASNQTEFQAEGLMAKCASKYEVGGLPPLEQRQ